MRSVSVLERLLNLYNHKTKSTEPFPPVKI